MPSQSISRNSSPSTTTANPDPSEDNTTSESTEVGFIEQLLRDGDQLDAALMDAERLPATLRRLLAVAVAGLLAHGLLVGFVSNIVAEAPGGPDAVAWYTAGAPVATMPIALVGAFLTATIVGLPSFYFYTRLAGVDASFQIVTAQSLRALAKTSVALLGVMPFYAAVVLSSQLGLQLDATVIRWGLALPFLVGLMGIQSVFASFRRLIDEREESTGSLRIVDGNRRTGLLFMVLAWGALFTTVAPVALWRYGAFLATL